QADLAGGVLGIHRGSSDDAGTKDVVHVDHADGVAAVVLHHQGGDLAGLHDAQGLGGEAVGGHRLAVAGHHRAHRHGVDVDPLVHRAAQVAIGEDAEQFI